VARVTSILTALALALTACTAGAPPSAAPGAPDEPDEVAAPVEAGALVVVTTSILGDVVRELVDDPARTIVLIGPGIDPHDHSLSAADAARLCDADLVVANGLGLEASRAPALEGVAEEGVRGVTLADRVDPLPFGSDGDTDDGHDHGDDDAADDDHEHGELDPHFWWDPDRMAVAIEVLADELATLPGIDVALLTVSVEDYLARLAEVAVGMEAAFGAVPADARRVVTNHDSLGYLAARFDLEVIGTVVPGSSTQAAVDAGAFAALVRTIEDEGVRVILAETIDSTALAEQLSREVAGRGGPSVAVLEIATDALGPPGSGTDTYLGLLAVTARVIAEALVA
jgi:ABC-type Zn uptake system ZnuABC Zn-binding protein ZnuA